MIGFSLLYSARTETRQWEVLSQPSAHRGWIVGECFNRWVSESSSQVISEWMYSICVFSVYMENTHSVSSNNLILSHLENSKLPNKNRKNFKKGNIFKKGILGDKEDPKRILKTHTLKHTLYISALFLFFFPVLWLQSWVWSCDSGASEDLNHLPSTSYTLIFQMPHWDAIVLLITTQTVGFGVRAPIFRLGWPGRLCVCNSNREQACGQWLILEREHHHHHSLHCCISANIHQYSLFPLRKQQLLCMLSIIKRGLEPILWSGMDWWSLLLGVWERLVCPAVLVTCLLSGPFLNGLCSSYYYWLKRFNGRQWPQWTSRFVPQAAHHLVAGSGHPQSAGKYFTCPDTGGR